MSRFKAFTNMTKNGFEVKELTLMSKRNYSSMLRPSSKIVFVMFVNVLQRTVPTKKRVVNVRTIPKSWIRSLETFLKGKQKKKKKDTRP